jgi:hypothetical protein
MDTKNRILLLLGEPRPCRAMLAQLMVFKDQLRSLLILVCVVSAMELVPVGLKRASALDFLYGAIISREISLK